MSGTVPNDTITRHRDPGDVFDTEHLAPLHDPMSEILCLQVALVHGLPGLRELHRAGLRTEHFHHVDHRESFAAMVETARAGDARWAGDTRSRVEMLLEVSDVPRWRLESVARVDTAVREQGLRSASWYAERVTAYHRVASAAGLLRATLDALDDGRGEVALELLRAACVDAGLLQDAGEVATCQASE